MIWKKLLNTEIDWFSFWPENLVMIYIFFTSIGDLPGTAFVIRVLKSTISRLATNEISVFLLVCVAEETGLKLAIAETPKKVFSRRGPNDLIRYNIAKCFWEWLC